MKNGSAYAKKLKQAYAKIRGKSEPPPSEDGVDPVQHLILAILSQETTIARGRKALKKINDDMVDLNDLRVSTSAEISESITRHIPRSVQRAKRLLRVLDSIYQREYTVSLQTLRGKGIRDVKQYLDTLDGMTPYVSGSVILWSLGGHAIPVNDPTLAWLQDQDLVHPAAEPAEVQSYLERHVSAADARVFCLDLEASCGIDLGTSKKKTSPAPKKADTKKKSTTSKTAKRTEKTRKKTRTTTRTKK